MTADPATTAARLAELLARECPPRRIDLAGAVALPRRLPHAAAWRDWLAGERHAGLAYLAREPEDRADPRRRHPWARSLLVVAQRYADGWAADDPRPRLGVGAVPPGPGDWLAGVSRYARGADYHDVLLADLRGLLDALAGALPGLRAHPAVDTGPYLEREWAWLAGLGFLGRNTCLIHEKLGSGLFLGIAVTNLEVEGLGEGPAAEPAAKAAAEPAAEPLYGIVPRRRNRREAAGPLSGSARGSAPATRCGTCRLCLDACPTGALEAPHRLDARLCISTWTIEWRGAAPPGRRAEQGGLVFGCDICQAVCPWNRRAAGRDGPAGWNLPPPRPEYEALPAHGELRLADLIDLDDDEFRRRFRRTPLWRAHPDGLRRNARLAAANAGRDGRDGHDGGAGDRAAGTGGDDDARADGPDDQGDPR